MTLAMQLAERIACEQIQISKEMIDFSSKHDILLENEDGSLQPMDVPFFQAIEFAPRTWQVLSDGD